jgi:ATP-dependent RNA helicase RhlE
MTGSGKTAAFLLPILHRLIDKPRGTTRALVLTPTRELAAQVLEDLNDLAVHTPITAAAVYGGVGMGPQEHAFRSGVDVLGFLPDIRRVLRHLPPRRQTLFFSATMPAPIQALTRELLRNPEAIQLERKPAPAVGITQAVYPVPQELKSALLVRLLAGGEMQQALVFTRTKHRANRLAEHLARAGIKAERIHGNRSQPQRTEALAGFKGGKYRVLVATDIAARGIDVEALGHVVNFDVPTAAEDYIHRVGRTARAEATGDAFTLVSPEEEAELRSIERALGKRLPRVIVPDFDYKARPATRFEVPIAERIAAIRAKKAEDRARSQAKAARRSTQSTGGRTGPPSGRPNRNGHRNRPRNGGSPS